MMAWTPSQCVRLAVEKKLVERGFPGFRFVDPTGDTYVEGWAEVAEAGAFRLRVDVPHDYPYDAPVLTVAHPEVIWEYGRARTVNSYGAAHEWHTRPNVNGHVCICHYRYWDASKTLMLVLLKGHLWLHALAAHWRTGRPLADFLRDED